MNIRYKEQKKGPIQTIKQEDVPKEPTALPAGFKWSNVDITDDFQADELCIFLNQHYIEDDDGNVRLYYSREHLRYTVMVPGYVSDFHFVVRNEKNNKIMAAITGTPKRIQVLGETVKVAQGDFLAVHKALRGKRLAQIMIQELMRRARVQGIMQGFYTSPDAYPTPFCTVQFMNRLLNVQKLIDVGFVAAPPIKQLPKFKTSMRLPDPKSFSVVGNIRLMEKKDASQVLKLYQKQ